MGSKITSTKLYLEVINKLLETFGLNIMNKQISEEENYYMLCVDPLFI